MKEEKRLFVDVHVIQTVPPSCVNRDDTGSPKTAVYGGVTRARISSQSWKRAIRLAFRDLYDPEELAVRTKKLATVVADEIRRLDPAAEAAEETAAKILNNAGVSVSKKKGETEYKTGALFFISNAQAKALAKLAVTSPETLAEKPTNAVKKTITSALSAYPGVEIALFGRMVADNPTLNTDACAQVAHSISTHKVSNEYDYFTAVDDQAPEDNAGAAHLGTVEFNASTLYRYATVAVHELFDSLGGETVEAVQKFVYAFVHAMPTGKQNTFANRTLPDAVMVVVRTDQPVNLVGAFEKPVRASENGYVEASSGRLCEHAKSVYMDYANEPALTLVTGKLLSGLAEPCSFAELIDRLGTDLDCRLEKDGEQI